MAGRRPKSSPSSSSPMSVSPRWNDWRCTTSSIGFACSIVSTMIIRACRRFSAKPNSASCASPIWINIRPQSFTHAQSRIRLVVFLEANPQFIAPHDRHVHGHGPFRMGPGRRIRRPATYRRWFPTTCSATTRTAAPRTSTVRHAAGNGLSARRICAGDQERKSLRAEASNAIEMEEHSSKRKRGRTLAAAEEKYSSEYIAGKTASTTSGLTRRVYIAEFAARRSKRLPRHAPAAVESAGEAAVDDWASQIRGWFQTFTELRWLCKR